MLDQGCRVEGVTLSNQILWWLPESPNLFVALHCRAEARFPLDSCETELVWNASCILSMSWCTHHSWLSPLSALHSQELLLQSPKREWWWPCPLMETFWIFCFQGDQNWCHSKDCFFFLSGSKWWTQVSFPVKIWEKKVSPSVSKHTNNSKEMTFLPLLCSNIRLRGTHLMYTLENPDLEWCD